MAIPIVPDNASTQKLSLVEGIGYKKTYDLHIVNQQSININNNTKDNYHPTFIYI